ncbi:MAG: diguanylate cyclase [Desulfovibrio sp.]|nr:MAG: diguanylate cyclase [Desulfovibrio sp.]
MQKTTTHNDIPTPRENPEETKVREAKLDSLYSNLPTSLLATLLNAGIFTVALWPVSNRNLLILWLSLNLIIVLFRLATYNRFKKAETPIANWGFWNRTFHLGLLFSGLVWGTGAGYFFPPSSFLYQAFIFVILGGMTVGSMAVNVATPTGFYTYSALLTFPVSLRCALQGTTIHLAIAGMVLVFYCFTFIVSKRMHSMMDSSIRLRYKNIGLISHLVHEQKKSSQLVVSLEKEIHERATIEENLRQSEYQFRTLTETTSSGIFIIQNERILYINNAGEKIIGYSKDQLKTISFLKLVHPDHRDMVRKRAVSRMSGDESVPSRYEFKLLGKYNKSIWVDYTGTSMQYNGKPALLGTVVDITQRKAAQNKLQELATTDSLTGLNNRRSFRDQAKACITQAKRYNRPLSLILLDVDRFKAINDTYGHDVGDKVLRRLAHLCGNNMRSIDVVGRIGGEEFAMLMPETALEQAKVVAERLRTSVANHEFSLDLDTKEVLGLTISLGVAELANGENLDDLLKAADHALYQAKKLGRDRVEVSFRPASQKNAVADG